MTWRHPKTTHWPLMACVMAAVAFCAAARSDGVAPDLTILEHLDAAIEATRGARKAVLAGDLAACTGAIGRAKQHIKEVSGAMSGLPESRDTLGKPMQELLRELRDAKRLCAPENAGNGMAVLAGVSERLQVLKTGQRHGPRPKE